MRLSKVQQSTIKQAACEVFGGDVRVRLFGSRTDDDKRGGDIDLYIIPAEHADLIRKKIQFLAKLDRMLGEQKIDVVICRDGESSIERTAFETGVPL